MGDFMANSTLITGARSYLNMPNPWLIHELTISGSLSKKNLTESMISALKKNSIYGIQITMDAKTGKAYLSTNDKAPAPISFFKEFQEVGTQRQAEFIENKHMVYADFFTINTKKYLLRLYFHHVLCDGKGGLIVINDFITELNARLNKTTAPAKTVLPANAYFKYLTKEYKMPFLKKAGLFYFNKVIAKKRPELSYEEMLDLQKKAFLNDGFAFKTIEFTTEETQNIITKAKQTESTVTAYILEKIVSAYEQDNLEIAVSIDGRKYYQIPESAGLISPKENPRNFATGCKINITKDDQATSQDCRKNISQQLKFITEPKNAAEMIKILGTIDFAPFDIALKKYAKVPMSEEDKKVQEAITKVLGFKITEAGFDFASFGIIKLLPTHKKYKIHSYRLIPNTTSVYAFKFGIVTYNDSMTIVLTYKPSRISHENADNFMEKIKTSLI